MLSNSAIIKEVRIEFQPLYKPSTAYYAAKPLRGGAGSSPFCYRGRGSSSLRCYRWGGLIRQNEGRNERTKGERETVPGERPSDRPYFQVRRGGKLPSTRESGVSPVVRPSTFCTCLFNRAVRGSVSRVLPKANMDWQSGEEGAFVPNHLFERAFSIRNCSRRRRRACAIVPHAPRKNKNR